MKDVIVKILRVILWVVGFPIIVIIFGVSMWAIYCIDFIKE